MSENNNNEEVKQEGDNKEPKLPEGFRIVEENEVIPPGYTIRTDIALEKTITDAPKKSTEPVQKFDPPKVLEAIIDTNQEQKETPTKFSLSNPTIIKQAQVQPTKADLSKQQQPATGEKLTDAEKLAKLDAEIKRDEGGEAKQLGYDDYKDSAETYMEAYEGILQFCALLIDKKGAPSTYEFLTPKKEKLQHQLTKVLRKHPKWIAPIEILFLGNLIPASTRIIMKAKDNRKDYMEMKRKQEEKDEPIEINKGGPDKGKEKIRRPGRPPKA